jgi:hypothetical protein
MTWRMALDRQRANRRRTAREVLVEVEPPSSLSDPAITRERVEQLWMAIDALPEKLRLVVARVRARVADEPAPMFWPLCRGGRSSAFAEASADRRSLGGGWSDPPFRWVFAAAAAVAVVIVASTVIWRSLDSAPATDGAAPAPLVAETSTSPAVVNPTEVVAQPPRSIEPVRRGRDLRGARRIAAVSEGRNLVAVIAPEDAKAFERLLASIRQPDVVLVLTDDTTGPAALVAASIEITPIDIDTVPPGAQLEGGVE